MLKERTHYELQLRTIGYMDEDAWFTHMTIDGVHKGEEVARECNKCREWLARNDIQKEFRCVMVKSQIFLTTM